MCKPGAPETCYSLSSNKEIFTCGILKQISLCVLTNLTGPYNKCSKHIQGHFYSESEAFNPVKFLQRKLDGLFCFLISRFLLNYYEAFFQNFIFAQIYHNWYKISKNRKNTKVENQTRLSNFLSTKSNWCYVVEKIRKGGNGQNPKKNNTLQKVWLISIQW